MTPELVQTCRSMMLDLINHKKNRPLSLNSCLDEILGELNINSNPVEFYRQVHGLFYRDNNSSNIFCWMPSHQKAYEKIKKTLSDLHLLIFPQAVANIFNHDNAIADFIIQLLKCHNTVMICDRKNAIKQQYRSLLHEGFEITTAYLVLDNITSFLMNPDLHKKIFNNPTILDMLALIADEVIFETIDSLVSKKNKPLRNFATGIILSSLAVNNCSGDTKQRLNWLLSLFQTQPQRIARFSAQKEQISTILSNPSWSTALTVPIYLLLHAPKHVEYDDLKKLTSTILTCFGTIDVGFSEMYLLSVLITSICRLKECIQLELLKRNMHVVISSLFSNISADEAKNFVDKICENAIRDPSDDLPHSILCLLYAPCCFSPEQLISLASNIISKVMLDLSINNIKFLEKLSKLIAKLQYRDQGIFQYNLSIIISWLFDDILDQFDKRLPLRLCREERLFHLLKKLFDVVASCSYHDDCEAGVDLYQHAANNMIHRLRNHFTLRKYFTPSFKINTWLSITNLFIHLFGDPNQRKIGEQVAQKILCGDDDCDYYFSVMQTLLFCPDQGVLRLRIWRLLTAPDYTNDYLELMINDLISYYSRDNQTPLNAPRLVLQDLIRQMSSPSSVALSPQRISIVYNTIIPLLLDKIKHNENITPLEAIFMPLIKDGVLPNEHVIYQICQRMMIGDDDMRTLFDVLYTLLYDKTATVTDKATRLFCFYTVINDKNRFFINRIKQFFDAWTVRERVWQWALFVPPDLYGIGRLVNKSNDGLSPSYKKY